MDSARTAKLFHTVVVLGIGLAQSGCSEDTTPSTPGGDTPASTATPSPATPAPKDPPASAKVDAGPTDAGTNPDAMPGWFGC